MNFSGVLSLLVLNSLFIPTSAENFTLTLFHTNDFHSHFEEFNKYGSACSKDETKEGKCFGGVARLAAALKDLRLKYPHSLLLDAGDYSQGTIWYTILREKIISHFMNALKYDAMAIGNHEFDSGDVWALEFLKQANFKVLSANVNFSLIPEAANYLLPSVIIKVNGQRIGIIGCITNQTRTISKPGRFIIMDEVTSVKAEVGHLKSLGINKIIALSHSGIKTDLAIAHQVEGVDVVVGGHTNTFLYSGKPPDTEVPENTYPIIVTQASGAQVAVVQDFHFAKYLGVLHVTFNESGALIGWSGNPVLLDKKYPQDPDMKTDLENWRGPLVSVRAEVIGETAVLLNNDKCRIEECNIGNMVADAIVQHFIGQGDQDAWTLVAISLINAGSIRLSIPKSQLTLSDQLTFYPFQNTVDIVIMEGRHIRLVLEHSVGQQYNDGGFMQVAGIRVVYDMSRGIGDQVIKVKIRCANCSEPLYYPLEDDREYTLATNSFILNGGDGFDHFKKYAKKRVFIGILDSDMLSTYIRKFSPLTPEIEQRITFQEANNLHKTNLTSTIQTPQSPAGNETQAAMCVSDGHVGLYPLLVMYLLTLSPTIYGDLI